MATRSRRCGKAHQVVLGDLEQIDMFTPYLFTDAVACSQDASTAGMMMWVLDSMLVHTLVDGNDSPRYSNHLVQNTANPYETLPHLEEGSVYPSNFLDNGLPAPLLGPNSTFVSREQIGKLDRPWGTELQWASSFSDRQLLSLFPIQRMVSLMFSA